MTNAYGLVAGSMYRFGLFVVERRAVSHSQSACSRVRFAEEAGPATDDDCLRPDLDGVARDTGEEAETHGDILLTPGGDVYRRLPDKLLSFFAW